MTPDAFALCVVFSRSLLTPSHQSICKSFHGSPISSCSFIIEHAKSGLPSIYSSSRIVFVSFVRVNIFLKDVSRDGHYSLFGKGHTCATICYFSLYIFLYNHLRFDSPFVRSRTKRTYPDTARDKLTMVNGEVTTTL